MSTQPLNIISRYGEDDISLWTVNVEFEDYKRVAGNAVQLKVELSRYLHRGSPPHTRGKVSKTPPRAESGRDHPRTRGEKRGDGEFRQEPIGSPPHTRGKVFPLTVRDLTARITPAHAGKRAGLRPLNLHSRDHPRTRGEKPCILRTVFGA